MQGSDALSANLVWKIRDEWFNETTSEEIQSHSKITDSRPYPYSVLEVWE